MKHSQKQPKSDKQVAQPLYKQFILWGSCLISSVLILTIILSGMFPHTTALNAGDVAETDIRATRDVVDTVTTEALRQQARSSVTPIFYEDKAITAGVQENIDAFIAAVTEVRILAENERLAWEEAQKLLAQQTPAEEDPAQEDPSAQPEESPAPEETAPEDAVYTPSEALLTHCGTALPISLTEADIITLLTADETTLTILWTELRDSVSAEMQSGIKEETLQNSLDRIDRTLTDSDRTLHAMAMSVVSAYLQVNFKYDDAATVSAQDAAAADVADVVYKERQNIVQAGEVITEAQIAMLSELGLANPDASDTPWRMGGLAVMLASMIGILWVYFAFFEKEVLVGLRMVLIINLMLVLTVAFCWFAKQFHVYFLPSVMAAMMVAMLVNYRSAMVTNFIIAVLVGFVAGGDNSGTLSSAAFPAIISTCVAGTTAIFVVIRSPQRMTVLLAGLIAGAINALLTLSYDLFLNIAALDMLRDAGMSLAGGFLAAMASLGLLPLFEQIFKVVTPMKLMELSNPNHPLLKRLMLEAPGTYHHSIMVGNLAESAADAIGANSLLVRTGAYYHDVGKLKRPYFFKENQIGTANPHDQIDPALSAKIIRSHTTDGYEMARKYRIPPAILDILQQHHGDTKIAFFYHKALQASEGNPVNEEDYRYPGPTPTTREAAIVMIADTVEAASRAMPDKTPEKLEELVTGLIRQKLQDGQFNNCAITMSELEVLGVTFKNVLSGVYHDRIAYPQMDNNDKEQLK